MRVAQSSLIRQAILSTVGVLVQGLARFGYSVIVGRSLGPDVLAQVNTLISATIILSLFWPTASGNAAGSFLARARAAGASPGPLLRSLWVSFAVSCAVLVAAGIVVFMALGGGEPGSLVAFLFLVVTWSAYILVRGMQLGMGRVAPAALWDVVSAIASIALLVLVIALDLPVVVLLPLGLGYGLFAAAGAVGVMRASRAYPTATAGERPAPGLWHFIGWNSAGLLATNGLIQVAMVFAFLADDPRSAGMFAAAMALATPASMLAQAVSQALIPRFSEWAHEDPAGVRSRYLPVIGTMAGLLAVAFGAVAVVAPWLLPLLYGDEYGDAVTSLRILLLGVFLFSLGIIASSLLITTGRTIAATVAAGVGTLVGIVTMIVVGSAAGGSAGAAWGVVAGSLVTTVAVLVESLRPARGRSLGGGPR